MVAQGGYSVVKGSSSVRDPRRRAGTLKVRTRITSLQKTNPKVPNVFLRQKCIIFAELDLN